MKSGTILGEQYEVQDWLGEGGMGVIHRARDIKLGRTVAIKTLSPHLRFDVQAKERFIQEAQAASALDRQDMCTVHDIGETPDGQIFVVMAFYQGQTLKHLLSERRLPTSECIELGA